MRDPSVDGARVFARIARDLAAEPDLHRTMTRLVEVSSQLASCQLSQAWEATLGGSARLCASSEHQLGREVEGLCAAVREGPAAQALAEHTTIVMTDIDSETRWPRFTDGIRTNALPIRSAVAFSLRLPGHELGALALYSEHTGHFTEDRIDLCGVIADHATVALAATRADEAARNLREALQSNRRIGIAIGVLMTLHGVAEEQAFAMLRVASQHNHVKLRDIAENVIYSGALPEWPSRQPAA